MEGWEEDVPGLMEEGKEVVCVACKWDSSISPQVSLTSNRHCLQESKLNHDKWTETSAQTRRGGQGGLCTPGGEGARRHVPTYLSTKKRTSLPSTTLCAESVWLSQQLSCKAPEPRQAPSNNQSLPMLLSPTHLP